jgi:outer membrane receptor protein involved in Fe transport
MRFRGAAALALVSTASLAQSLSSQSAEEFQDLSLEQLLSMEITTGSFLELDLQKSAVSLTFIDQEKIRMSGARHLGELLEIYVPGFHYMYNKWNGGAQGVIYGMRGTAMDQNRQVIILMNGLKLNFAARDGAMAEVSLGMLGDIDHIEVLRGPAGLVYGTGAISGIVNIVTRTPKASYAEATVGAGSWRNFQTQVLANTSLGGGRSLTLAGGAIYSRGFGNRSARVFDVDDPAPKAAGQIAHSSGGYPTDGSWLETDGNFRGSADYTHGKFRLYARFTHEYASQGPFHIVNPYPESTPRTPVEPRVIDGEEVAWDSPLGQINDGYQTLRTYLVDNLTARATHYWNLGPDKLFVEAAFAAAGVDRILAYREGYASPRSTLRTGALDAAIGERRYLGGAQYLLQRIDKLQAAFGLQYKVDDIGGDFQGRNFYRTARDSSSGRLSITPVVYQNLALYTESYYQLLEKLAFTAGVRLDVHTRSGANFSPKAGAVYAPSESHSFKLFVQSALNQGDADAYEYNYANYKEDGLLISSTPTYFDPANPAAGINYTTTLEDKHQLQPERALSFELASTHKLGSFSVLSSASYTQFSNLFAWAELLKRPINSAEYKFLSAEVEILHQKDGLTAGLSHGFQKPIDLVYRPVTVTIPRYQPVANGDGTFHPEPIPDQYEMAEINSLSNVISKDGTNFVNLPRNITKAYVFVKPISWLTLHSSLRVVWGMPGRKPILDRLSAVPGTNDLGIQANPMLKWNVSASAELPRGFGVSLYAYDLLGSDSNLHAVRRQHVSSSETALYTLDQRAFMLELRWTERDLEF